MNAIHRRIPTTFAAVIMIVFGLAGCGNDSPNAPKLQEMPKSQLWRQELTGLGMSAIWGAGSNLLYASDGFGFVTRYNGTSWEVLPTGIPGYVTALWGSSADNVYGIVGKMVLRFDGNAWQSVYTSPETLHDVWASSPSDVFAVGDNGTIVHWDGTAWTPQDSGVDWRLASVEGSGPNAVYAQGSVANPSILRYAGSQWEQVPSSAAAGFASLAVNPNGFAFCGNDDGCIYGGTTTLTDRFCTSVLTRSLAVRGLNNVFGAQVDGNVFQHDVGQFTLDVFTTDVREVWAGPWGYVYGVGFEGQVVYHDGAAWRVLREARPAGQIHEIFGTEGTRFAIGTASYVFDGSDWVSRPLADPLAGLAGWAISNDFAVAVGENGAINHWDGISWGNVTSPTTSTLVGAWASSETDAFAIGSDGTVLHYDGSQWSIMTTLPYNLSGIHGMASDDVWVSSSVSGYVFHYDGASWDTITVPSTVPLTSIWAVSPSNVFAVGDNGVSIRYDGATWKILPTPTGQGLIALWAGGPSAVFALTTGGDVIRFDGEEWVEYSTAPGGLALDLWGDANCLFTAGSETTVYSLDI
jgi:hypothetical protein